MTTLNTPAFVQPSHQLPAVGAGVGAETKAKMRQKAQEFEAYYVQQFIALTRPDLSETEIFGGGYGEQMFADKLDEEMGKAIAKRGGFGIGDHVYAELLKMQENQNSTVIPAKAGI